MKNSLIAVALGLAYLSPAAALADFTACNETDHPVGLALAHSNGIEWISEGWWTVAPHSCADILSGDLKARYYYVHALHHEVGGGWTGDRYFCVTTRSFTITGRDECEERGYSSAGFFEVDTGDALDWREELYVNLPSE